MTWIFDTFDVVYFMWGTTLGLYANHIVDDKKNELKRFVVWLWFWPVVFIFLCIVVIFLPNEDKGHEKL